VKDLRCWQRPNAVGVRQLEICDLPGGITYTGRLVWTHHRYGATKSELSLHGNFFWQHASTDCSQQLQMPAQLSPRRLRTVALAALFVENFKRQPISQIIAEYRIQIY